MTPKRLNAALASKVQELARYRSQFLADKLILRNLGILASLATGSSPIEVLFGSGSAEIGDAGAATRTTVQNTSGYCAKHSKDINWVLRVDGHTGGSPIKTIAFLSWELSTARAISVVKYLISTGIPASNLAAAGFGEFQLSTHGGRSPIVGSKDRTQAGPSLIARKIELSFGQPGIESAL